MFEIRTQVVDVRLRLKEPSELSHGSDMQHFFRAVVEKVRFLSEVQPAQAMSFEGIAIRTLCILSGQGTEGLEFP
jgi:hypothetical protein